MEMMMTVDEANDFDWEGHFKDSEMADIVKCWTGRIYPEKPFVFILLTENKHATDPLFERFGKAYATSDRWYRVCFASNQGSPSSPRTYIHVMAFRYAEDAVMARLTI